MTVPTPICPILTCLCPSRVIRIIPEHPMPLPNPLAPSRANSCLSNALPNTPTPLHLVNAFPTRRSFNLSPSSHQVNSRHPHPFPTRCLSTFTLLRQVYSQHLIGLATVVGRSPITYLPCSMRPSSSFLALYIYVSLLSVVRSCHITHYPLLVFYVSSSVPHLRLPLFHLSLFLTSITPTLVILYIPYDPFPIVQIILIITTPHTCINTLSTSCCSSV